MVVAVAAVGVGSEQVAAAIEMVVADEGSEGAAAGVREQGGSFIAGVDDGQVAGIVTEGVVVAQAVEADVVKAAGSHAAEGVAALCRLQTGVVGGECLQGCCGRNRRQPCRCFGGPQSCR